MSRDLPKCCSLFCINFLTEPHDLCSFYVSLIFLKKIILTLIFFSMFVSLGQKCCQYSRNLFIFKICLLFFIIFTKKIILFYLVWIVYFALYFNSSQPFYFFFSMFEFFYFSPSNIFTELKRKFIKSIVPTARHSLHVFNVW